MTASRDLDVYDVAFLAGGPARVVQAALTTLVTAGRVRANGGLLSTVDPVRSHPVEAAVLDAVGTRGHRSVETVGWRVRDDDRLLALGRRLTDAGLLPRRPLWPRRPGAPPAPTRAGRDVLRQLAGDPRRTLPMRVALDGWDDVPDPALRPLTERPAAPAPTPGPDVGSIRDHRRDVLYGDPAHNGVQAQGAAMLFDGGAGGGT